MLRNCNYATFCDEKWDICSKMIWLKKYLAVITVIFKCHIYLLFIYLRIYERNVGVKFAEIE